MTIIIRKYRKKEFLAIRLLFSMVISDIIVIFIFYEQTTIPEVLTKGILSIKSISSITFDLLRYSGKTFIL